MRILYERKGAGVAVHYREWYAMLQAAGYVVLGARPHGAFLTNVRASPCVRKTDTPGTYLLDAHAPARLTAELAEQQAAFAAICERIARNAASNTDSVERTRLTARVQTLEHQLAEATMIFASPPTTHTP
ncbi:MAG TPA: hypothetical protein VGO80_06320 [Solirubrobacteraceae bacterium]|jgi:hypothetical protein|nr:hypothetical protein [Solirubrobacteraceae bacterium]